MKVFIFALLAALVAVTLASEDASELERSPRSALWARSGVWGAPVWGGHALTGSWGHPAWGVRSWGYPAWGARSWGAGWNGWW